MLGRFLAIPCLLPLAASAAADQLDEPSSTAITHQLSDLGYIPVPAFSTTKGSMGKLTVTIQIEPGEASTAQLSAKGAHVWGPIGWCEDCGQPMCEHSVIVNVGDGGTPLLIGTLRLAPRELAEFDGRGFSKVTLDELPSLRERSTPVDPMDQLVDEAPIADDGALGLARSAMPEDLRKWTSPGKALIVVEADCPKERETTLDEFVLLRDGEPVARCCGALIRKQVFVTVIGSTRIVRTSRPLPFTDVRYAEAVPYEVVHSGMFEGEDNYMFNDDQMVFGKRLMVHPYEDHLIVLDCLESMYLLGPDANVTTVHRYEGNHRPAVSSVDTGRIDLLFEVDGSLDGEVVLARRAEAPDFLDAPFSSGDDSSSNDAAQPRTDRPEAKSEGSLKGQSASADAPPAAKWPKFTWPLKFGKNFVTFVNQSNTDVIVGLRSVGHRGADLRVPARSQRTERLANSAYEFFISYQNEPLAVYQGETFTVMNANQSFTIHAGQGNYPLKRL